MNLKASVCVAIAALFTASNVNAAPIVAGAGGAAVANGSIDSVTLNSNNGAPTPYAPPTFASSGMGFIDVTATSLLLDEVSSASANRPVATFTTGPDTDPGALTGLVPSRYQFNFTITNNNILNDDIGAIDFFIQPGGTAGATFVNEAVPGGNGTLGGFNFLTADRIRFGGLNGGGGTGIGIGGGSTTLSFLVDIPGSSAGGLGSFSIGMVANPEPASLALGGMALMGFGGVVARRRRKKKQAEEAAV